MDVEDLFLPVQESFFEALTAALDGTAEVFVNLPENYAGNFALVGQMDDEEMGEIDGQLGKLTVEVQYIYRGDDRRVLIGMMKLGRKALDRQTLTSDAAALGITRYVHGSVSTASRVDGKTYAGIQTYMLLAQPA